MARIEANVKVNQPQIVRRFTEAAIERLTQVQADIKSGMLVLFDLTKTGASTKRGRRSAPDEPPARQSERLAESIETPPLNGLDGTLLRVTAPYASLLQEGTVRMAARPYVDVAVEGALQHQTRGFLGLRASGFLGGAA